MTLGRRVGRSSNSRPVHLRLLFTTTSRQSDFPITFGSLGTLNPTGLPLWEIGPSGSDPPLPLDPVRDPESRGTWADTDRRGTSLVCTPRTTWVFVYLLPSGSDPPALSWGLSGYSWTSR